MVLFLFYTISLRKDTQTTPSSHYGNSTPLAQESDMYSTTPPTHTDPQYGNTTSTKSLTCTPLHPQPTLTLSMVTPPVPRV